MKCPKCFTESRVVNSRETVRFLRRRRECLKCKHRWSTIEKDEDLENSKSSDLKHVATSLAKRLKHLEGEVIEMVDRLNRAGEKVL